MSAAPKTAHTPGPWTYVRDGDYWQIEPTGLGGKDNYEGNEADYRLAAAAPELLDFAALIIHYNDKIRVGKTPTQGQWEMFVDRARALTAKAVGAA